MADEPPTSLGEYIRRQRELHELSMRQVAEMAGISNPYLSQIERGLREPSEVEAAIARDARLTARQRQALLEVYRSFAGRRGSRRSG